MRKGLTEVVFIIDKSGSMSGLEADTIGGFNSVIEEQKDVDGEVLISTVLFSDENSVIYDRVPVKKVEPMSRKMYRVGGCTALLDAIGGAIHHIGNVHKYARDEDRPEKTLFIIITDGEENSSYRYSQKDVKKMVEYEKEKYNWEFIFLGANMDAITAAERVGISGKRAFNYESDEKGTQIAYEALGRAVKCHAMPEMFDYVDEDEMLEECFLDVKEDYQRRHNG